MVQKRELTNVDETYDVLEFNTMFSTSSVNVGMTRDALPAANISKKVLFECEWECEWRVGVRVLCLYVRCYMHVVH